MQTLLTGRILILILLLACCQLHGYAQQKPAPRPVSNLRVKKISTRQPLIQLDSLSLIPNTIQIPGVPDSAYTIDFINRYVEMEEPLYPG